MTRVISVSDESEHLQIKQIFDTVMTRVMSLSDEYPPNMEIICIFKLKK